MEKQAPSYLLSLLAQWRELPPNGKKLYKNDKTANDHG
jgi:hypothetical protein